PPMAITAKSEENETANSDKPRPGGHELSLLIFCLHFFAKLPYPASPAHRNRDKFFKTKLHEQTRAELNLPVHPLDRRRHGPRQDQTQLHPACWHRNDRRGAFNSQLDPA